MLTVQDRTWLSKYPTLNYGDTQITGRLYFKMAYNKKTTEYTLSPAASQVFDSDVIYLSDDYQIKIEWHGAELLPLCYETEGKLKAVARERMLFLHDMHVNPGGDFCLAAPQRLKLEFAAGFDLQTYIEKYVIPFLFLQSHFQKTGTWAWSTAGHGLNGILEWYHLYGGVLDDSVARRLTLENVAGNISDDDRLALLRRLRRHRYKGHMTCFCGKRHKIRNCSSAALYALNTLRKDMIGVLLTLDQRAGVQTF